MGLPLSVLLRFFPEHGILLIVGSVNVRVGLAAFRVGVCLVLAREHWL